MPPKMSRSPDAEEAVCAVAREKLVAELLSERDAAREHVSRQQTVEEVVVAPVAVASRQAEHAGDGVRLEHRPNGVRRHAEPVGRPTLRTLEVARAQRPFGADPLEHAVGHLGVLGEDAGRVPAQRPAKPREVPGQHEGESLVVRLEDLAPLVEQVAPGGVVVGHARVQEEIVGAPGDRERIELDRAQATEDLEHGVRPSLERPCWSKRVARDEKAACGLSSDAHAETLTSRQASRASSCRAAEQPARRTPDQPCARQTVPVMVWVKLPLVRSSSPSNVSVPVAPANMPVP